MSWTNSCSETNEFKVKNKDEVKEVFEALGFSVYNSGEENLQAFGSSEGTWFDEDAEVVLSKKPIEIEGEKTNFVGLISDYVGDFDYKEGLLKEHNLSDEEVMVIPIMEYLQDQLEEGHAIVITCTGFEERCSGSSSPFGDVTFITKNTVEFTCLSRWVENRAKELGVEV